MRIIIAGSRTINDYDALVKAIKDSKFPITTIISGGARGVDALAERYAREHNITLYIVNAQWMKFGKAAGPIRNRQMADIADGLIALHDGKSPGTKNMIDLARKRDLEVFVAKWEPKAVVCQYCINCKPCSCECHEPGNMIMHVIDCCYECPQCGRTNITPNWNKNDIS